VIEGMTIAGLAVGATQGYIYLRIEYPHAARSLAKALQVARAVGYVGQDILGSGKRFDIAVRLGAGAYICGEETSMLERSRGRRGEVRVRPPLPAIKGLFGQPPWSTTWSRLRVCRGAGPRCPVLQGLWRRQITRHHSAAARRQCETRRPGGARFRLTVKELVYDYGGGSATGRPVRAVQIGGPLGAYLPVSQFDTPLEYEALSAKNALLGHGGVVVFDDRVDMARMARYALEFCAVESCGKCTPCRIGSARGVELVDRIIATRAGAKRRQRCARLEPGAARRTLRHHVQRFAVWPWWFDALPGAQRTQTLP
jgi:formate dehydrogenase iron-sulfur subunit